MARSQLRSAAVEDVVAEFLHLENRGIGATGERLGLMRLDHFADHDVMIALLDDRSDLAMLP